MRENDEIRVEIARLNEVLMQFIEKMRQAEAAALLTPDPARAVRKMRNEAVPYAALAREILNLVRRMGDEGRLELPLILLCCSYLSLAVGNPVESDGCKREARDLCQKFGVSYCYIYTKATVEPLEPK